MKPRFKNLALWIMIAVFTILLFNLLNSSSIKQGEEELIFSDFMIRLDKGDISEVTIKENHITGTLKDGQKFKTYAANYPDLVKVLRDKNVKILVKPPDESPWYLTF